MLKIGDIMSYQPIERSERIELIDALRGFALFGILMVNMLYMYAPMSQMMLGAKANASTIHIISESFIKFFFEGKFYVIFSMLFGFGFFIFMNKITDTSYDILPIFRRRLLFLLLFGVAHISLLWAGDVLVYYSLCGFILILFRKSSDKKLLIWAIILALFPIVILTGMTTLVTLGSQMPEVKSQIDSQFGESISVMKDLVERANIAYSTGTFGDIFSIRMQEYFTLLGSTIFFFCPVILSMFITGYLIARKGVANYLKNNNNLLKKTLLIGLFAGISTSALYVVSYQNSVPSLLNIWSLMATSMHIIGGFSLGLSYVAGITLLFSKGKNAFFSKHIAPVGRMALTNYLLQSVITSFLFHSYGLALYGKVEIWQGIVLTILIFTLQIFFSKWWLSNYKFGPLEWLWRSLTYSKFQPMKLTNDSDTLN